MLNMKYISFMFKTLSSFNYIIITVLLFFGETQPVSSSEWPPSPSTTPKTPITPPPPQQQQQHHPLKPKAATNVYRFSNQQVNRKSGDPTMSAILMECPKVSLIKGEDTRKFCEEKILVNIRMSSKQRDVS